MFNKYTFWIKTASVFQLITAFVHSLSLFKKMEGQNESEIQMIELMNQHKLEMGAGFSPTMMDIFISLSACLTYLYLLGGLNNLFLFKKLDNAALRGYLLINLLVFGTGFCVNLLLTFIPPIILTGLVFIFLLISYLMITKTEK